MRNISWLQGIAISCALLVLLVPPYFNTSLGLLSVSYYLVYFFIIFPPIMIISYMWRTLIIAALLLFILHYVVSYAHQRSSQESRKRYEAAEPVHLNLAFNSNADNFFTKSRESITMPFVYPESEAIEQELNEIINLILVQYVHSWYVNISGRELVPHLIERLIREILITTKARLARLDLLGTLVRRSVPIITRHLYEISVAEAQVKDSVSNVQIDALEHNSISDQMARNTSGGKLHPLAQAADSDFERAFPQRFTTHPFLRKVVEILLANVISAAELSSPILKTMLREIMTCSVLAPVIEMLSDPHFWNQIIVTHAHQAIQERARVKRFRHVLKEQTSNQKKSIKRKPIRNLERLMLSNDSKDWDRLYRKIKKSQSLPEVSRMRSEMRVLQNEMFAASSAEAEHTRITGQVKTVNRNDAFVMKAMSLLETRIAILSGNQVPLESSLDLSFDRILTLGMGHFFDFMRERNREPLLEFWHQIMLIKSDTTNVMHDSQIFMLDSDRQLSKLEISKIFSKYFKCSLLTVTDDERTFVHNYIQNEPDTYDSESNAIVSSVARRAYRVMVNILQAMRLIMN